MKVLVFGAGAIGTYIGGSLALAGARVVFIERPDVAEGILERGMHLILHGVERLIPHPQVTGSLEQSLAFGPYDVAIFALKSNDTQSALEGMKPYLTRIPPLLCLQNGVENEPTLSAILGYQSVIPGTVTSAIGRRSAGDIVLEKYRGMGLADGHPLSQQLTNELNNAGLNAHLFRNALDMKWSKMLTNLLANATSAILDMTPIEIFANPRLYRLEVQQLREALQVMKSLGVTPVNLPGVPVRLLAFGIQNLPLVLSRPLLRRAVGTGRGAKMPSFHIDLYNRRGTSEVDYLNGAVFRHGMRQGIPTPVNRLLNETLISLTAGEIPLQVYAHNPEALLQKLKGLQPDD
jgi:2-dehydropantoate 2-reductase